MNHFEQAKLAYRAAIIRNSAVSDFDLNFDPLDFEKYDSFEGALLGVEESDKYFCIAKYYLVLINVCRTVFQARESRLETRTSDGDLERLCEEYSAEADRQCEVISDVLSELAYTGFMFLSLYQVFNIYHRALRLQIIGTNYISNKTNQIIAEAQRLEAAGIRGRELVAYMQNAQKDVDALEPHLKMLSAFAYRFFCRELFSLVENWKNPDLINDEELIEVPVRYGTSLKNHNGDVQPFYSFAVDLDVKVEEAIKQNQSMARAREKEKEELRLARIKKFKELADQMRRRDAVKEWWSEHPSQKENLDNQSNDLSNQLREINCKFEKISSKVRAAKEELSSSSEVQREHCRVESELMSLRDEKRHLEEEPIPDGALAKTLHKHKTAMSNTIIKLSRMRDERALEIASLPSSATHANLISELEQLERKLNLLGPFSLTKKRRVGEEIAQKRNEINDCESLLKSELVHAIEELEQERIGLQLEIADLGPRVAEERARGEASRQHDIETFNEKINGLEAEERKLALRVESEREERAKRLQPLIDRGSEELDVLQNEKDALSQKLQKVNSEIADPSMPSWFIELFDQRYFVGVIECDKSSELIDVISRTADMSLSAAGEAVNDGTPIFCESRDAAKRLVSVIESKRGVVETSPKL